MNNIGTRKGSLFSGWEVPWELRVGSRGVGVGGSGGNGDNCGTGANQYFKTHPIHILSL